MGTKVSKGTAYTETTKEKEMLEAQKQKWIADLENVDQCLKLLNTVRGKGHITSTTIRGLAEKILADKA